MIDALFYTPNFGASHTDALTCKSCYVHRDVFTQRKLYTNKEGFCTQESQGDFTHGGFLHAGAFKQIHAEAFIHRVFCTQTVFKHKSFCTGAFTPTGAYNYGQKVFSHRKLLKFYTAVLFHTRNLLQADAFIYTQKPLHTEAIIHRNFYTGASTHKYNFFRWKHTKLVYM